MAFEKILKTTRTDRPTITIRKSGQIAFNKAAAADCLDGHRFADVLIDRDENRIGVRLSSDGDRKIAIEASGAAAISVQTLADEILEEGMKYVFREWTMEDDILVLSLADAEKVTARTYR